MLIQPTNIYDLPWDSFQSRYNIKRKKRKKKRHATSACRDYPIYRNIVACNAEVRDRVIRKGYIPFRSAKRCIPKCIYVQRTVCSGESVVSSLTHRLGADLPREKYGATAAAMRYEEKQSAVRFHVPEAGINERCLGAALPLSFRLLRDACTRTQSFGLHNRGTRHREQDVHERDTYGLTALHEEKHGRPLASVTQRRLDESSCSPSDCVPVETRW